MNKEDFINCETPQEHPLAQPPLPPPEEGETLSGCDAFPHTSSNLEREKNGVPPSSRDDGGSPRISVLMGIYNCADTLVEALDSLYAQTYQGFKMILCDDGSTDETYRVASDYGAELYSEPLP